MRRIILFSLILITQVLWAKRETQVCVESYEGVEVDSVFLRHDNLDAGIPTVSNVTKIIDREGYACGYSDKYKQSLWVQYRLTADETWPKEKTVRKNNFHSDKLLLKSPTPDDYNKSGYDRGHLAPAADMSWSENAMDESFNMSNMSPQVPELNRGTWKDLEDWTRLIAQRKESIIVVSGPIFYSTEPKVIGSGVDVPDAFFKVIYDEVESSTNETFGAVGFIIPNTSEQTPPFIHFMMSVKNVEKITKMTFFSKIKKSAEYKDKCDWIHWDLEHWKLRWFCDCPVCLMRHYGLSVNLDKNPVCWTNITPKIIRDPVDNMPCIVMPPTNDDNGIPTPDTHDDNIYIPKNLFNPTNLPPVILGN